ncbi:MAG TPA: hypothetical protein VGZ00_09925 [Candidatus Baltobacteraceae bacterium]|nr:hypothetical protein [Candidatus Baltobacteraceae bacterium]
MRRVLSLLSPLFIFPIVLSLASATSIQDGAVIVNSGSTNSPSFHIAIWSNGSAALGAGETEYHGPIDTTDPTVTIDKNGATLAPLLTARFFADLKRARNAHPLARTCVKSVSFGSRTFVLWHGWTSPDLSCPVPPSVSGLAADVKEIVRDQQAQLPLHNRSALIKVETVPTPSSTGT